MNELMQFCGTLSTGDKTEQATLRQIIFDALDYASFTGLLTRQASLFKDGQNKCLQVAPLTILPTPYSRKHFNRAEYLQKAVNKLIYSFNRLPECEFDAIVCSRSLGELEKSDPFIARLIQLYRDTSPENKTPPKPTYKDAGSFGVLRTDYMIDEPTDQLVLVEINTIASGLASHGSDHKVGAFHKFTENVVRQRCRDFKSVTIDNEKLTQHSPENKMLDSVISAFCAGYRIYAKNGPAPLKVPAVLFVVEEQTWNAFDQRGHDFKFRELMPDVDVHRYSLPELDDISTVDSEGRLLVNGIEMAVAYFRAGYDPSHYPDGRGWIGRENIERSRAVKCPNIKTHLLTFKRIQFDVSTGGFALEKEIGLDNEEANDILETVIDQRIITKAQLEELKNYDLETYVLKPMTEGGSRLRQGEEIYDYLANEANDGVEYMLMKKIIAAKTKNFILSGCPERDCTIAETTQELGIWGAFALDGTADQATVAFDETSGYIMRSKYAKLLFGGFANASAALDTVYLE